MKNQNNSSNITHSEAFNTMNQAFADFDHGLQLFTDNIKNLKAEECLALNKKFDSTIQNLAFINNAMNSLYQSTKPNINKTSK